jgi:Flp pilus assembly protein TadB
MAPQRGLIDDLRWALAVLAGVALAALVFSAGASALVGAVVGVALVLAARALLRHRRRAAGSDSR